MADFQILVLPGAFASSVAATIDVLRTAEMLAPRLKLSPPSWGVASPDGGVITLNGGMQIDTAQSAIRSRDASHTCIVPGLGISDPGAIEASLTTDVAQRAVRTVAGHAGRGGKVAASCSAVFLLQAAGLLARRRVTTSWWLAAALQRLEPSCNVDADKTVCADGPLTTAGAAFAQTDLILELLRAGFGAALANAVARSLLLDGRQSQAAFVVPLMLSNGNALIARLIERLEASLPHSPDVQTLADEFAMSPRTLSRHVRNATGRSTMALIQSVRLNRARTLIESSSMTIELVAEHVGYGDSTALRRLMRKSTGATPSQFRSSVHRA